MEPKQKVEPEPPIEDIDETPAPTPAPKPAPAPKGEDVSKALLDEFQKLKKFVEEKLGTPEVEEPAVSIKPTAHSADTCMMGNLCPFAEDHSNG